MDDNMEVDNYSDDDGNSQFPQRPQQPGPSQSSDGNYERIDDYDPDGNPMSYRNIPPEFEYKDLMNYRARNEFAIPQRNILGFISNQRVTNFNYSEWKSSLRSTDRSHAQIIHTMAIERKRGDLILAGMNNGKIAFCNTVGIWTSRGKDDALFSLHKGPVESVQWFPYDDSAVATASSDKSICLWSTDKQEIIDRMIREYPIIELCWEPFNGNTLMSIAYGPNVDLRDLRQANNYAVIKNNASVESAKLYGEMSPYLYISSKGLIRLYDIRRLDRPVAKQTEKFDSSTMHPYRGMLLAKNRKQIVAMKSKTIKIYDAFDLSLQDSFTFEKESHSFTVMDLLDDGCQLLGLAAINNVVKVINLTLQSDSAARNGLTDCLIDERKTRLHWSSNPDSSHRYLRTVIANTSPITALVYHTRQCQLYISGLSCSIHKIEEQLDIRPQNLRIPKYKYIRNTESDNDSF